LGVKIFSNPLKQLIKYQNIDNILIYTVWRNLIPIMSIETYEEITGIRKLCKLLEEADNDIKNGNFLTEEEMDKFLETL
jgi:hypothetical protein